METFFIQIVARLTKQYSLTKNEAQEMLYNATKKLDKNLRGYLPKW